MRCGWAGWQGGKIPRAGKSASGKLGKGRKGFHGGEAGITDFGERVVDCLIVRIFEVVLEDIGAAFSFVLGFARFAKVAVVLNWFTALLADGRLVEGVDFLVGWFAVWGEAHRFKLGL